MGPDYHENDLVYYIGEGKPYEPSNFSKFFQRDLERSKIGKKLRFHDLRYTLATLALQKGISPKTIQKTLGHTSITTALDLYTPVTEEMEEHSADVIGKILEEGMNF